MPRSFPAAFRADFESPRATNVVLMFMAISHPTWEGTAYLVNDVVNYTYNGIFYIGFPFDLELLGDEDKPPRGQITIQNVDRQIGENLLKLVYGPFIALDILSSADWNTTIDPTTNSRLPIGTPTLIMRAKNLQLWDITVNESQVTASFGPPDVSREFYPQTRCTKQNTPGLFR